MKKVILSVIILLSVCYTFAQTVFQIHGHRGARGLAPENTLAAFYEGAKYKADYLELDVVITKDNYVLVSHEPWLRAEICENVKGSPKDNNIFNMTLAEVLQYDCGSKFVSKFPEQKKVKSYKPLLSEVIDSLIIYCEKNYLKTPKINVEIKCHKSKDGAFQPSPKTFAQLVYNVLKEKNMLKNVMIQSFDLRVLQEFRQIDSTIPQGLLIANFKSVKQNVKSLGYTPTWYNPYFKLVNKKNIQTVHSMGMVIVPWTVNKEKDMKKLKQWGVDGVITDYPNLALPLKE